MTKIIYSCDEKGIWTRYEFAKQCKYKDVDILSKYTRCQGIENHEGDHWCYTLSGCYATHISGKAKHKFDSVASVCPPGNNGYKSPEQTIDLNYRNNGKFEIVTDESIIKELNKGKTREKGAVISSPVVYENLPEEVKEYADMKSDKNEN